jgi:hypothetical protein
VRSICTLLVTAVLGCAPSTPRDPTDHPPLLQIPSLGGPVLASPSLYVIVWPGDDQAGATLDGFLSSTLTSDYWTSRLGEYGVGPGRSMGVTVSTGAEPPGVETTILGTLVDSHVGADWPSPDAANGALMLLVPSSLATPDNCALGAGYHTESPSRHIPYAMVLPSCPGVTVTETASHEAAELSTDPHPRSAPAFIAAGVEIADACVGSPYALAGTPVARLYSNQIAALGNQDPCGPAPDARPFFGAALSPGAVTVLIDGTGHGTGTFSVEPFSYGDAGPIDWVVVADYGKPTTGITFVPSSGRATAGDTVTVTIQIGPDALLKTLPLTAYSTAHQTWQNAWYGSLTVAPAP